MNRRALVNQVKAIIIDHAKPARIWLYGSVATGDAKKYSDIDIAYLSSQDDKVAISENLSLVIEKVQNIETLHSIDVSCINLTGERFANRVKTTGRVIFSETKALRAEDAIFNFGAALNRFNDVISEKEKLLAGEYADIYPDLAIKRFEFTYEMAWKAIKRTLGAVGIAEDVYNPRSSFKEAFKQGWLEDEQIWLSMIEKRNLSAHVYDASEVFEIIEEIDAFAIALNALNSKLLQVLDQL